MHLPKVVTAVLYAGPPVALALALAALPALDRLAGAPLPPQPLCASPAIAAWNPAAAGPDRGCQPTLWAGGPPAFG